MKLLHAIHHVTKGPLETRRWFIGTVFTCVILSAAAAGCMFISKLGSVILLCLSGSLWIVLMLFMWGEQGLLLERFLKAKQRPRRPDAAHQQQDNNLP